MNLTQLERIAEKTDRLVDTGETMKQSAKDILNRMREKENALRQMRMTERMKRRQTWFAHLFHQVFG